MAIYTEPFWQQTYLNGFTTLICKISGLTDELQKAPAIDQVWVGGERAETLNAYQFADIMNGGLYESISRCRTDQ
jgi:hypothetical protein